MKVSFLILNYKSYQDTIKVTYEILNFKPKSFIYDVVIVDNKSPNESYDKIRKEFVAQNNVTIIEAPSNGGYSAGNNVGLRYMHKNKPDYVCIMNNDVHFDVNIIEYMICLDEKIADCAFLSPLQLLPNGKPAIFSSLKQPTFKDDVIAYMPILFTRLKSKWQYIQTNKNYNVQKVDIVPGALLFIKYDKFEKIGFFDESTFLFCEERFTSQLVKEKGLSNYIVLDKTYLHEHSKTINAEANQLKQLKYLHDGKILFTKKYRNHSKLKIVILDILYRFKTIELRILNFIHK